ncbi:hypothetical protein Hypma_014727 [Hypsizygus marmoreus]|uniref:Uncharacterized protein n=1 Tax=Hypsizygus marmoreus TaxID=39966 RepID=A0A369J9R5_HYPMA|nr:hypothetical protein Hypma_014727 [Hypsizygus marmoreus]
MLTLHFLGFESRASPARFTFRAIHPDYKVFSGTKPIIECYNLLKVPKNGPSALEGKSSSWTMNRTHSAASSPKYYPHGQGPHYAFFDRIPQSRHRKLVFGSSRSCPIRHLGIKKTTHFDQTEDKRL